MNYKQLLPNRRARLKLLDWLWWVPDEWMVRIQYRIHVGHRLNLKKPERFTEKLQWYKLHYRDPRMWRCVDKAEVHEYLARRGFGEWLNEIYGVYGDVKEINFSQLPSQFVVKTTSGGGGIEVYVCRENNEENRKEILAKFAGKGQSKQRKPPGREWAYEKMPPSRIIVERFIENSEASDEALTDYKFYCFGGRPHYCQVIGSRTLEETIDFFDTEWNHQDFYGLNPKCGPAAKPATKPANLEKMVELAGRLAEDFPFVRVDLYNVKGRIYFGELTFYPASGYGVFTPDQTDYKLGQLFNLPK